MYGSLGYAVVAADYTGLGTGLRNAFLDIESNARDVIYSIPAARTAVPQPRLRLDSNGVCRGRIDCGPNRRVRVDAR